MNIYSQFLLLILIFSACKERVQSVHQLIDYCNDPANGLCSNHEFGEFRIGVIYRPAEIIIAQEIKSLSPSHSNEQIDSVIKLFKGIDYFLLRLQKQGNEVESSYAKDPLKFRDVNNYLTTKIGDDIRLVYRGDTLRTKGAIHTRTFGSSKSTDVLVAFDSSLKDKSGEFQFIFEDKVFDTGLHVFEFEAGKIKSIPLLDLTKQIL